MINMILSPIIMSDIIHIKLVIISYFLSILLLKQTFLYIMDLRTYEWR